MSNNTFKPQLPCIQQPTLILFIPHKRPLLIDFKNQFIFAMSNGSVVTCLGWSSLKCANRCCIQLLALSLHLVALNCSSSCRRSFLSRPVCRLKEKASFTFQTAGALNTPRVSSMFRNRIRLRTKATFHFNNSHNSTYENIKITE